ncbi:MAG: hypothetical protein WAO82_06315 [Limnohabitans sp.]
MKVIAFLFFACSLLATNSHAQIGDSFFTCQGRVDQDQRKLILLNLKFKLGGLMLEGDLNGDPIVGSNFGAGNLVQAVAYPKSQDTGNTRDIKHKMTANINQQDGQFNMTIVGVHGHSFYLSGSGQCQIQN